MALADALEVPLDYLVRGGSGVRSPLLRHRCLLYDDDRGFVETLAPFLVGGLAQSDAVLVVTAQSRIRRLKRELGQSAASVEFHESRDWYGSPAGALARYSAWLREASRVSQWTRVVGEPVWTGLTAAATRVWLRYESLINLSLADIPATVVCPYDRASVPERITAAAASCHPEVEGSGGISVSAAYKQPEMFLLT
jgi:hypothetical protein